MGRQGDRISPKRLYDLGFTLAKRPIVFLNGCGSGDASHNWEHSGGLASAFLNLGAYGCVVSIMPIEDRLAAEFAVHFYDSLVNSKASVGEAMVQTRKRILGDESTANDASAYFFSFYGDPRVKMQGISSRKGDLQSIQYILRPDSEREADLFKEIPE